MLEISELIYETCKTYLITQGKFILILELFIGTIMVIYFGCCATWPLYRVAIIILFSLIGIGGSYTVAWFGIRVNTFANSRTAFAALEGRPYPCYAIPLKAGMSIGTLLISIELLLMLMVLLFVPRGPGLRLLHRLRHRRIARRLGAAHRRRHLHQDRRHRLGPDEDRLQHQGRRRAQPGRDRRLHRRQRRRLGRPDRRRLRDLRRHRRGADLLHPARRAAARLQGQLIVWLFVMRVMMIVASILSYAINEGIQSSKYATRHQDELRGTAHLLVWLTSIVSVVITYVASYLLIGDLGDGTLWWKLSTHHHLRHARRRDHPRGDQGLHLDQLGARARMRARRRRRAARRSTCSPASSPATSPPSGWAW